ncbi:MAG: PDZ domain-containing protein [Anaerolineae bacterium]|nr:PDZ domain-containing protein [Anaerolineae bacterium]
MIHSKKQNTFAQRHEIWRSILIGTLIGLGIAVVFAAGFMTRDLLGGPLRVAAQDGTTTEDYPLLMEVQRLVDQHFLREQPSFAERQAAAVRGMLATLADRYTFLVDPPVARSESDVLAGTYGGIGVQLQRNEAGEFLMYPFDDSPAARAGIETGDILLAVNGMTIDLTMQQDQIDQLLRGEVKPGSGVELTYRSRDDDEETTTFIDFDVINVPSVIWRVLEEDERVGYVHVLRFTNRTPGEVRDALTDLKQHDITGLVLDLRDNSGGLLAESVQVADEFLDTGELAYRRSRTDLQGFEGEAGGEGLGYPLVVIVNGGTASGAELLAGAIQDMARGILVGQKTYGKGTIQEIYPLSDQSSLHVTSAEWLTPDQRALEGIGLTPDIEMIPDANGRDVEMGEALRYLSSKLDDQTG